MHRIFRNLLVYAAFFGAILAALGFYRSAIAAEDGYIVMPPPVPTAGGVEVKLPYPPGPDFSWFRKDNLSLEGLTGSKPAADSSESHRLVAGASGTVGRIPWYIQVLAIVIIAILFVGSYFYYRYGKSKRSIDSPVK